MAMRGWRQQRAETDDLVLSVRLGETQILLTPTFLLVIRHLLRLTLIRFLDLPVLLLISLFPVFATIVLSSM